MKYYFACALWCAVLMAQAPREIRTPSPVTCSGSICSLPDGSSLTNGTAALNPVQGLQPLSDWCVDAINGDDLANDGTCPATGPRPYKTIAKLLAQTITAGQTICIIASPSQQVKLRESFITPAASLVVTACGPGASPILDGSDILPNASFTVTDAPTNTYQQPHTADRAGANIVWEGGVAMTFVASVALVKATAGTTFYDNTNHITYIHSAAANPDPTANGLLYEAATRSEVIQDGVGKNGVTYSGLTVQHGWSDLSAMLIAGNNNTVQQMSFIQNANHHLNFQGANNLGVDLYGLNCAGGAYVFFQSTSTGNTLRRVKSYGTTVWTGSAFQTHNGANGNVVEYSYMSQSIDQTVGVSAIGISDAGTNITVRYSTMTGNFNRFMDTSTSGGAGSSFYYNVINGTALRATAFSLLAGATAVGVYNNTFYNASSRPFLNTTTSLNTIMKNNLVYTNDFYMNTTVTGTGLSADYNLWYSSPRGAPFNTDLGAESFAQWQSVFGLDTHGVNADPLFVSAATGDFRLSGGSPAIGTGVVIPGITPASGVNIGAK